MTNPLGAAENALIGAALNAGRGTSSSGRNGRGGRHDSGGLTASEVRAAKGAEFHDRLASLMAVQRARFAPAQRPVLPSLTAANPQTYFTQAWADRKREVSWFRRGLRKQLRAETWACAQAQAAQQLAEAEAAHTAEQQRADTWWAMLNAGEAEVVTGALQAAFADNPAPVTILSAGGTDASLVVWLPDIDVLPNRRAHVTPSGRLSTKAWTKTELNDVYAELLGAHLLATLRETWAVAPSITQVRVAGVMTTRGENRGEVLFDVAWAREAANWDDDQLGPRLLSAEGGLQRVGRTREARAWLRSSVRPEVAALLPN